MRGGVTGEKMTGGGGHFLSLLDTLGLPRVIPGDEVIQREKTMKFLDPPPSFFRGVKGGVIFRLGHNLIRRLTEP